MPPVHPTARLLDVDNYVDQVGEELVKTNCAHVVYEPGHGVEVIELGVRSGARGVLIG